MKVSTTQSPGIQYQCFISTNYQELREQERISIERGLTVKPIISIDNCNSKWMLAVETIKP
jgi:hypothetical protein